MRTALLALLLLSSCSCAAVQIPLPDPEIQRAGLRRAAFLDVSCLTAPGGGYGSVVLLDRDTAITARHVVAPGRCPDNKVIYEVVLPSGARYMVVVAKMLPKYDLARLEAVLEWPDPGPAPRFAAAPTEGQVCQASGFPNHWWTCGGVQEADDTIAGAELRFSSPVFPGNSGSGLYDASGRLVGIVTRQVQCAATGQVCGGAAARLRREVFE